MTAAATKFRCPELIAENTVCSDLVGRVSLSFLQQREVGTACGEFYRDVENLGLTPDNDGFEKRALKNNICYSFAHYR